MKPPVVSFFVFVTDSAPCVWKGSGLGSGGSWANNSLHNLGGAFSCPGFHFLVGHREPLSRWEWSGQLGLQEWAQLEPKAALLGRRAPDKTLRDSVEGIGIM